MLNEYVEPVSLKKIGLNNMFQPNQWARRVNFNNTKNLKLGQFDLAIVGVTESRQSPENRGCAAAPDEIRKQLYHLFRTTQPLKLIDLGNIKPGKTEKA